jgi:hypothetical protein
MGGQPVRQAAVVVGSWLRSEVSTTSAPRPLIPYERKFPVLSAKARP